jgi:hypothetical protein
MSISIKLPIANDIWGGTPLAPPLGGCCVGGRFCLSLVLNRQPVSEGGLEEGECKVQALLLSLF